MLSWTVSSILFGDEEESPLYVSGLGTSFDGGSQLLHAISSDGETLLNVELSVNGTVVSHEWALSPASAPVEDLDLIELGNETYLVPLVVKVAGNNELSALSLAHTRQLALPNTGEYVSSIAATQLGGTTMIFIAHSGSGAIETYVQASGGGFSTASVLAEKPGEPHSDDLIMVADDNGKQ